MILQKIVYVLYTLWRERNMIVIDNVDILVNRMKNVFLYIKRGLFFYLILNITFFSV